MLIVSSADKRFSNFANKLKRQCEKLKYNLKMYDLGGLNFGEPARISNDCFVKNGYYKIMNSKNGWCSRALHKPEIIKRTEFKDFLVYMDSDAFPVNKFDEIKNYDFDIGVTERNEDEKSKELGRINAGVMFFRNTKNTYEFLQEWSYLTQEIKNDQLALNTIVESEKYKIKKFPTNIYNYYYFPKVPEHEVKIYHFKSASEVRSEFLKYAIQM